jgi:hypothetical protein
MKKLVLATIICQVFGSGLAFADISFSHSPRLKWALGELNAKTYIRTSKSVASDRDYCPGEGMDINHNPSPIHFVYREKVEPGADFFQSDTHFTGLMVSKDANPAPGVDLFNKIDQGTDINDRHYYGDNPTALTKIGCLAWYADSGLGLATIQHFCDSMLPTEKRPAFNPRNFATYSTSTQASGVLSYVYSRKFEVQPGVMKEIERDVEMLQKTARNELTYSIQKMDETGVMKTLVLCTYREI